MQEIKKTAEDHFKNKEYMKSLDIYRDLLL